MCWKVRKQGLRIGVTFDLLLEHRTSVTYDSGNDKEFKNRQEYYKKAGEHMNQTMIEIYGENWAKMMQRKLDHEM